MILTNKSTYKICHDIVHVYLCNILSDHCRLIMHYSVTPIIIYCRTRGLVRFNTNCTYDFLTMTDAMQVETIMFVPCGKPQRLYYVRITTITSLHARHRSKIKRIFICGFLYTYSTGS